MVTDNNQNQSTQNTEKLKQITEYVEQLTALKQAENDLAAAQTAASTSGLETLKTSLSDLSLPGGKEGTISFAAGTEGTALLRSKIQMLKLIDDFSRELAGELKDGAVVVTEEQLEKAYTAEFNRNTIEKQITSLTALLPSPSKRAPAAKVMMAAALPVISAGISTAGSVVNVAHGISKLFRTDRTFDIFQTDAEAAQLLGYFLEKASPASVANPDLMGPAASEIADKLRDRLDVLLDVYQKGDDWLTILKAKTDSSNNWTPEHETIASLKSATETAKGILDALHPVKNTDGFWEQVKGSLLFAAIESRPRILIQIKAQAIQITEKRVWLGDRIKTSGEIQVSYRVLDTNGSVIKTGVILRASKPERAKFHKMPAVSFP
jgi:hypothetical protein